MSGKWQFWIDRGGTFTDLVAHSPDGRILAHKLLSENTEWYPDAAIQGIRDLMGLQAGQAIPTQAIEVVKMGTTAATNALLEGRGEPVVLVTSKGLGDALRIGYQNRPDIFALKIEKPEIPFHRVIEVEERVTADGSVLLPLDQDKLREALVHARQFGFRAAAIVFMHAYRFPDHEGQAADLARAVGFEQVSTSHQVSALIKFVARGETTVVDAYLSPVLNRYIDQVRSKLGTTRVMFMQSNGGLVAAGDFRGRDSVLSGPAGGVVGAVRTCEHAGIERIITFDMGGTSTDVAHYHGAFERTFDRQVAGIRIRAPMMLIHTVAAGGGSVVTFDGERFQVGPASAGAMPGPACYGRGGPITVTDCNLLLGRLAPECFPNLFGPSADQPLDVAASRLAFEKLLAPHGGAPIAARQHTSRPIEEIARGCLDIAVENMAQAIKQISVQRGYDVSRYTLCCYGGAGGQLVCRVAESLNMTDIFVHPLAGVLSALGMGLADVRAQVEETVERLLDEAAVADLRERAKLLSQRTGQRLRDQGTEPERFVESVHIKYTGTDRALEVPLADLISMRAGFENTHRTRYGFLLADRELVAAAISVEAIGGGKTRDLASLSACPPPGPAPRPFMGTRLYLGRSFTEVPIYRWESLPLDHEIEGPALIVNDHITLVVDPGWRAVQKGHLRLRRTASGRPTASEPTDFANVQPDRPRPDRPRPDLTRPDLTRPDPVLIEIFNSLFMSIAEQMGFTLENTSASVNIKERLDFSCAVFDRSGNLIANAPHMPVHLGSMGESVMALIAERGADLAPGNVYASNNPFKGGTHLPDITVITPVFDPGGGLRFFTASRGHHADIGGITPGSMPPFSTHIGQEGVLLDNVLLVNGGQFREHAVRALLDGGPHPSRNTGQNIADLKAQIAANAKGAIELLRMVDHYSLATVETYMDHIQDYAESRVRRVIGVLRNGWFRYTMDQGPAVEVAVRVDAARGSAVIDFTGTSPVQASNFNAPAAVTKAAVLYVFRTLIRENIPLNAGCLRPLTIILPAGCLLNPVHPAAVVAGNVETSQVVTDALYGALGLMAAAQGTMNNFTFGDETHQYYETICGGAGAGPDYQGADAVHTHMTNSRLTDPEILETRFPVLLEAFAIRPDSGGAGRHRGGHGVIRRIRFLAPMAAAILSNRRLVPPFGLEGGQPGRAGINRLERADGTVAILGALAQIQVQPGDVLVIETPGGGGYGPPGRG